MPYEEIKYKIDQIKEQITAHGKLDDNQLKKINYKFRLEWNYNSNSMEGNTLTIAETRSVMVGNLDVHQKPLHDVLEMKGHDEIVSEILKIGKGELRLSEKRIQQIHKAIIHESDEIRKNQIGIWKQQANEIINYKGEKYSFAAPDEVPEKMHDLLNRTNAALDAIYGNKKNAAHPLDVAFKFHLEFLDIHPFHDGNGRVARILSNLILIATGYPPFWITKPERTTYYNYIADIQGYGGKPDLFYEYMAGLVLRSQQLVLDVVEGKDIEGEDDLDKEISLLKANFEGLPSLKSIDILVEIYKKVKDDVLIDVWTIVNKFQDFFYEIKAYETIDGKINVLGFPFVELREALLPFTSFTNHNVNDIYKEIIFTKILSRLKRGKLSLDIKTEIIIKFEKFQYSIILSVNDTQVFANEYKYYEHVTSEDRNNIKKEIKNYFLNSLKQQLT